MKVGTSDLLQIYARLGSPKSTAQYFRHFAATSNDSLIPTRNIFLICSGNRHFHASVIYKSTQIPSSINNHRTGSCRALFPCTVIIYTAKFWENLWVDDRENIISLNQYLITILELDIFSIFADCVLTSWKIVMIFMERSHIFV